jgi:hypothetical protein
MVICIIQKIDAHCHYVAVIIKQRRLFDLGEKNDEVLYWLVYICSVFDFQRSYITLCLTSLEPRIWMKVYSRVSMIHIPSRRVQNFLEYFDKRLKKIILIINSNKYWCFIRKHLALLFPESMNLSHKIAKLLINSLCSMNTIIQILLLVVILTAKL